MSDELDKQVVKMEFDNSKFEKNVKQTRKSIDELNKQLEFKEGQEGIIKVEKSFSHLEMVTFSIINRITNKILDLGITMTKSLSIDNISAGWSKFGQKTIAVATLSAQAIKVAGKELDNYDEKMGAINDQIDKLNFFSDETSYSFNDMIDNVGKFTAAGRGLDESVSAMMGIANWAALSGQNASVASRAMYQLAQALGKGYVQLIDWKSIQTANMDTQEFRKTALETAVSLGELTKEANYYISKTGKKFTQDQFTESLNSKWFTNNVLLKSLEKYSSAVEKVYELSSENGLTATETMEHYGDQLDAFGLKAFRAAQEARTFSDAIMSVKDAVSTGWMTTSEKIFGQYDEARKLWTELANELYDVFAEGGNFRNEVLGLWNDLGGRNNVFGEHGSSNQGAFWNIYDSILAVKNVIRQAWSGVFDISSFTSATDRANDIATKLKVITTQIQNATKKIKDYFTENVRVRAILQGTFNVIKIGIQVIQGVWYALDPIVSLAKNLVGYIFDKVAAFGLNLSKIQGTSNGIAYVATKINNILNNIIEAINPEGILDGFFNLLSKIFKAISDLRPLEKFESAIKSLFSVFSGGSASGISGFFNTISNGISKLVGVLGGSVSGIASSNVLNPLVILFEGLSSFIRGLLSIVQPLISILGNVFNFIGTILQFIGKIMTNVISVFNGKEVSNFVKTLLTIAAVLGPILAIVIAVYNITYAIIGVLKPISYIFTAIGDTIYSIGVSMKTKAIATLVEAIGTMLLMIAISAAIIANIPTAGFMKALVALSVTIVFIGGLAAFLFSLVKQETSLEGLKGRLQNAHILIQVIKMISSIGRAMLMLAVALKIVSTIDTKKLLISMASIIILMGAIFGMVVGFNKLLKTKLEFKNVDKLMKSINWSVLSLAVAMKVMSKIEPNQMMTSVKAIIVLMGAIFGMVVGFNKLLKTKLEFKNVDKLMKSINWSVLSLAVAMKIISTIDPSKVETSIAAIIILLGAMFGLMVAFNNLLKTELKFGGAGKIFNGLSAALIGVAVALKIVASIKNIGAVWSSVGALIVVMSSFMALMVLTNKLGGLVTLKTLGAVAGMIGLAAALIVLSIGLSSLAIAISQMNNINLSSLGKAIIAIIAIKTFAKQGLYGSAKMMIFGVALIAFSIGLSTLVGALNLLAGLNIGDIAKRLFLLMLVTKSFAKAGIIKSVKIALFGIALSSLGVGLRLLSDALLQMQNVNLGSIGKFLATMLIINLYAKKSILGSVNLVLLSAAMLALSIGLSMFATSLAELETLSGSSLLILVGIFTVLGLLSTIDLSLSNLLELALVMVPLAGGISLLALSLKLFEGVSIDSVIKGLLVLVVALATLALVSNILKNTKDQMIGMVVIATTLAVLAGGIALLAVSLRLFERVSFDSVLKGLLAMIVALTTLALIAKFLITSTQQMVSMAVIGASLLILSAGLMVMALALQQLESVSWSSLAKGGVMLAGAILLLVATSLILGPGTILVLALGAAVMMLGAGMLMAAQAMVVFTSALPGFTDTIIQNANSIKEALTSLFTAIGEALLNMLNWVKENIGSLANALIDIVVGILDVVITRLDEIVTKISEIVIIVIETLFNNLGSILGVLLDKIYDFIVMLIPKITEIALGLTGVMVQSLLVIMASIISLAITSLGTLGKLILNFLAGILLVTLNVASGMTNILIEFFRTIVANAFYALAKALEFAVVDIPRYLGGVLKKVGGAILKELGKMLQGTKLNDWFGWGDSLVKEGEKMQKAANSIFDPALLRGDSVVKELDKARSNISSTVGKITDNVKKDMTDGVSEINNALVGSLSTLKDTGRAGGENAGDATAQGFADTLGIRSPSRVFAQLGLHVVQGLSNGLSDNTNVIKDSAVDMMNDTINAAKNVIDGNIDDDLVIRPIMDLSSVESGVSDITSLMSNVSGARVSVASSLASGISKNNGRTVGSAEIQNGTTINNAGDTYSPVFNITSNNPQAVAEEVDVRMQRMRVKASLTKGGVL